MTTFKFSVLHNEYQIDADSAGSAMQWMNRNVMDALNMGPFAWMDGKEPNTYYCSPGNYWD
jgi:hypothetical protein